MSRFWLSFVDRRPGSEKFLGVSIVDAPDNIAAVRRAHELGINPGGEVAMLPVPDAAYVPEGAMDRLLGAEEAESVGSTIASSAKGAVLAVKAPADTLRVWLSICDLDKPDGERFVGVQIVDAFSLSHAVLQADIISKGLIEAGARNIEIQAEPLKSYAAIPAEYLDRLLSADEVEALTAILKELYPEPAVVAQADA